MRITKSRLVIGQVLPRGCWLLAGSALVASPVAATGNTAAAGSTAAQGQAGGSRPAFWRGGSVGVLPGHHSRAVPVRDRTGPRSTTSTRPGRKSALP